MLEPGTCLFFRRTVTEVKQCNGCLRESFKPNLCETHQKINGDGRFVQAVVVCAIEDDSPAVKSYKQEGEEQSGGLAHNIALGKLNLLKTKVKVYLGGRGGEVLLKALYGKQTCQPLVKENLETHEKKSGDSIFSPIKPLFHRGNQTPTLIPGPTPN